MAKSENGKKYALIAAICYAVYAAYSIINRIIYVSNAEYATITALNVISWLAMIGMAVALFIKKEKILIGAAGTNALLCAYYLISHFSLWNLLDFVAYAALTSLLVLALKGNGIAEKIWFVPGAAALAGCLIGWIQNEYFSFLSAIWKSMLFGIVEIAAIFFVGMWIKEKFASANAKSAAPVNAYATFDHQAVSSGFASTESIGGADKLMMYKELLDSGTITQEEFDAKKKQILGL